MELEKRYCPVSVRSEGGKIKGVASVFYDASNRGTEFQLWEGANERVMPTAFDPSTFDRVLACFNHDRSQILGRHPKTLSLSIRSDGLHYEITPNQESHVYRTVQSYIDREEVDGSSFAFRVKPDGVVWRQEGDIWVRELHHLELIDVSPVTDPAYTASKAYLRSSEVEVIREEFRNVQERMKTEQRIAYARTLTI